MERFNNIFNNGSFYVDNLNMLILKTKNKKRTIGRLEKIDTENFRLIKHEKPEGIFRKNNSWSIPYNVIKNLGESGIIVIYCSGKKYKINSKRALEVGDFLYFKNSGVEKKIYIPLKYWNIS